MKHCKRLSFKQILTIIFIAFLFYSCKSTKDLPYVPLPVENVIHESFKNDNVRELIGHYLEYPEYIFKKATKTLFPKHTKKPIPNGMGFFAIKDDSKIRSHRRAEYRPCRGWC